MKISEQNKGAFLHKLMSKANIGWWEADLKTETYKCSELISELLGLEEDGVISFEDFNQRILREDQSYTTFPSSWMILRWMGVGSIMTFNIFFSRYQ